ncbi:TIGR00153 family protein [Haliea sp.]|jgi:predicted phosphate transport protein (TIGR00153 family)|uniref:TIGR00153 family protein n=1 Tax=Haliea TaxID=475794 RepID=UPI000C522ACD|nr:TIGR00153 family protein [Haliea sp.]HCD57119.1 TIGR00153 family protein [Halieaceae bacterium]MAD63652.1 TIGR00153 family protein [Haliea sp.]MAY92013.1 TIGR00153 family protein [Haliea sp.]MBK41937.1 TIGR00153 family protein [Haliea sp.]MBP70055.1 TIGR00153 family protein [Haliea sp.]
MPSSNPLSSLFGRSPIGPIQEHMQVANDAAQLLPAFLEAAQDDDWKLAEEIFKRIGEAEEAADKLKRSVRRHLPNSLFLPVPRTDLLELVTIQDHVANTAKDIAGLMLGREMRFPEKLEKHLLEFARACTATCEQALVAIRELDELLEVGFTGREVVRVEGLIKELDKLEGRTDKQSRALRARLFKLERKLYAVDVMFYYKVIELLAGLADSAERVGHRLQILMAK